jgi:hypothetical protein
MGWLCYIITLFNVQNHIAKLQNVDIMFVCVF